MQHLDILRQGVSAWNTWRKENPDIVPDLRWANLRGANLEEADLEGANLTRASLHGANLEGADLRRANLYGAFMRGANLTRSDLRWANLTGATGKFSIFSAGQHYCIAVAGYASIGCEHHPIEWWQENYLAMGEKYHYTPEQIERYKTWLDGLSWLIN